MAAAARSRARPDAARLVAARGPGRDRQSFPAVSASSAERSWRDRELHFIAIGGAGMSGLALVCAQLGARVTGSDRAESSYLRRLREPGSSRGSGTTPSGAGGRRGRRLDRDRRRQPRARPRARARPAGHPPRRAARRALRAAAPDRRRRHPRQDDDGRDARPRAARDRRRPALLTRRRAARRRARRASRANAGWGAGEWVVAEADESDASFLELRARDRRGHQRRARPPLALGLAGGAARGLRPLRRPGAARRRSRHGPELDRRSAGRRRDPCASTSSARARRSTCGSPAATTCSTRARRWRRSSSPASRSSRRRPRSASFPGMVRRQERKRQPRGRRDLRRLRPSPDRGRGDARGAARARAAAADRGLSAAPLLAHEGARGALRRRARRPPTRSACSTSTRLASSRVGELAGVSGLDVARATADRAGGRPVWWLRDARDRRAARSRAGSGEGDLLVTIGAGDVYELAEALVEESA